MCRLRQLSTMEEAGATLLALPGTGWTTRLRTSSIEIVRTALEAYGWEAASEDSSRRAISGKDRSHGRGHGVDRIDIRTSATFCGGSLAREGPWYCTRSRTATSTPGVAWVSRYWALIIKPFSNRWHAQGIGMIVTWRCVGPAGLTGRPRGASWTGQCHCKRTW